MQQTMCANAPLLDHLVGGDEQFVGHCEPERFRGLEIDQQLELGRYLHRELGRLFALENATDVLGGAPVLVRAIDSKR
jgi:hypothetical protein